MWDMYEMLMYNAGKRNLYICMAKKKLYKKNPH